MRLLVIEDDFIVLKSIQNAIRLRKPEWDAEFVQGPLDLRAKISRGDYDVILSDIKMPLIDGLALLEQVRSVALPTPVVLLTCLKQRYEHEARERGAFAVLEKPIDLEMLFGTLENAAQRKTEQPCHSGPSCA